MVITAELTKTSNDLTQWEGTPEQVQDVQSSLATVHEAMRSPLTRHTYESKHPYLIGEMAPEELALLQDPGFPQVLKSRGVEAIPRTQGLIFKSEPFRAFMPKLFESIDRDARSFGLNPEHSQVMFAAGMVEPGVILVEDSGEWHIDAIIKTPEMIGLLNYNICTEPVTEYWSGTAAFDRGYEDLLDARISGDPGLDKLYLSDHGSISTPLVGGIARTPGLSVHQAAPVTHPRWRAIMSISYGM